MPVRSRRASRSRSGSDAQDAQVYRKPGAAPDPDAGRSRGGRVCADAAYSRGHLRAPPRLRRHERQSARHRALSRRARTRSPADRPVPGLRMGLLSPRLRDFDVVGQARGGRNCGAPADLARDRRDSDRDRHPHRDPARHYLGVEAEQLDRSRGAHGRHRGNRDAVVLARDRLPPGRSEHLACGIRRTLDAADRLCSVLAGSAAQPVGGDPARAYRRLPLLRRHHAHDPLGDARGPARGLYPDRPRERPGRTADRQSTRAQERAAAGRHLDRHRVRLPDRRPRGDRAGVQHQRGRPPARAGDPESGLYLDAGPGHAHGHDLRARQSGGRLALCVARSAHPLRLTGARTVVDLAPPYDATAAAAVETPRSLRAGIIGFCRRQPLGTVGLVVVMVMAVAGLSADWIAPYSPTSNNFAAMTEAPSWAHLMGTDQFGRDLFSRIIFGARTALIVGFSCAIVGGLAGLVLGVASAYFGGRLDLLLQRVFDVMMAITIPLIPRCARVVRSSALAIREVPYIDAARACGFGHTRIILRHMVPNVLAPFLIMLTAFVGQAILAEA